METATLVRQLADDLLGQASRERLAKATAWAVRTGWRLEQHHRAEVLEDWRGLTDEERQAIASLADDLAASRVAA